MQNFTIQEILWTIFDGDWDHELLDGLKLSLTIFDGGWDLNGQTKL